MIEKTPTGQFAQILTEAMLSKGVAAKWLSDVTGCSYVYIRKLQTGKSLPSRLMMVAISNALGLDPESLERPVVQDKFRLKHGDLALEAQGVAPGMEQVAIDWQYLKKDQKEYFTAQIHAASSQGRIEAVSSAKL